MIDGDLQPLLSILALLLRFYLLIFPTIAFNIDTNAPIFKFGPTDSYFGYAVAQHYFGDQPMMLVGAPKADSGQPATERAGAMFSCQVTTSYAYKKTRPDSCTKQVVEYQSENDLKKPVDSVFGRQLHYQGKNHQLLGSVVVSSGVPNGIAMVCAPLVRYHNTSAYTDGTCFILENNLNLKELLVSCSQPGLSRTDRHNEFGSCMEGFSGFVDKSMIITGLPGAKKWTGGVFSRLYTTDIFSLNVDRWTMGVETKYKGVRSKFQGHDYLGFSVHYGRFGFWFEDNDNSTIVTGATRYNQTGAVTFLPFKGTLTSGSFSHQLSLTEDSFMLLGSQLGSSFGYTLEVLDLNNDGFDDLLVGAPFEYSEDADVSSGGAVYVYFSSGVKRKRHENSKVFLDPIKIRGGGVHSQFGISITTLHNVDDNIDKFNDFAVGAPFENNGEGAVYIYHGSRSPKDFKLESAQTIHAKDLPRKHVRPIRTFGFSLSGGVDMDNNGYGDLLVGAFASDAVVLLRAKPVINIRTKLFSVQQKIDFDGNANCHAEAQTCFSVKSKLSVDVNNSRSTRLLNFATNVFTCTLEVKSLNAGIGTRARFVASGNEKYTWQCGRNAQLKPQIETHMLYIPKRNSDWLNSIKIHFYVKISDDRMPEMPPERGRIVDLNNYPVLNKFGSEFSFVLPFNKKCGNDNVCICALKLKAALPGISINEDSIYVTQVGDKAAIDVSFVIINDGERAFEALLYIHYNSDELDVPVLSKKSGPINIKSVGDNNAVIALGNPMNPDETLKFELSFKLARGRTEGLGKPLEFKAIVNSTSEEVDLTDNVWTATVKVIKRAELELTAVSDPSIVRFGGEAKGESAMEFTDDIGPHVVHKYTVFNKGPWPVANASLKVEWPYQVESLYEKGKWALYLAEPPMIQITDTDNKKEIKKCIMSFPSDWVNPLQLKLNIESPFSDANDIESEYGDPLRRRFKRSDAKPTRELRIKPTVVRERSGELVHVVRINCGETAKCFVVTCNVDFLDVNVAAVVEFRSRLWNSTFIEDYHDVTYVEIASSGRLTLDPEQGIEDDASNNYAFASTHAYPDRPAIFETAPIPWLYIIAAIIGGLLLLLLVIFVFWKCGFFKRNRPREPTTHRAIRQLKEEDWSES